MTDVEKSRCCWPPKEGLNKELGIVVPLIQCAQMRMFKQHIDVYRKAWTDAGHPGEAPV